MYAINARSSAESSASSNRGSGQPSPIHRARSASGGIRVVSIPSCHVFDQQSPDWREGVLPKGIPIVSVEAGSTHGWHRYVGGNGRCLGIDSFGESAAPSVLYKHFGLTSDAVVVAVESVL